MAGALCVVGVTMLRRLIAWCVPATALTGWHDANLHLERLVANYVAALDSAWLTPAQARALEDG